ncbi:MAG: YgjP-like metallopeptidase domain-containing protein, partial [Cyanobacteria bacterium J06554_6]
MNQLELFPPDMPPYKVRESQRAKRVSIKISVEGEVEVVVPPKFDRSQLDTLIERRRDWIVQTRSQLLETRTVKNWQEEKPETVELRSSAETWQVVYEKTADSGAICLPIPGKKLKVRGDVDSVKVCGDVDSVLTCWRSQGTRSRWARWLS